MNHVDSLLDNSIVKVTLINFVKQVPSLSHWQMDKMPFYTCCLWQDETSLDCEIFLFERRASQDCVGYQPPGAGTFTFQFILLKSSKC